MSHHIKQQMPATSNQRSLHNQYHCNTSNPYLTNNLLWPIVFKHFTHVTGGTYTFDAIKAVHRENTAILWQTKLQFRCRCPDNIAQHKSEGWKSSDASVLKTLYNLRVLFTFTMDQERGRDHQNPQERSHRPSSSSGAQGQGQSQSTRRQNGHQRQGRPLVSSVSVQQQDTDTPRRAEGM